MPTRLHRPYVGLMPEMPQSAAGPRIDPPVSDPVPPRISPAATAAPVPEDDPAVKCSRFHGLRAGGQGKSNDGPPKANSWVESLPSITVPASAHLATVRASRVGTLSFRSLECAVVRIPAVQ